MSPVERRLRDELDEAREEIQQLREMLSPAAGVPAEWGLARQQDRLFRALLARDAASTRILQETLRQGTADMTSDNVVKQVVCQLRRKTKAFGVSIRTIPKEGYALDRRLDWQRALRAGTCRLSASVPGYPARDTPKPQNGYTRSAL